MLTKRDLESLAQTRLDDAAYLFEGGRYSAAYYLAGYSAELGIKACIAGLFQANVLPERSFVNAVYSHKLDDLLGLAGVKKQLLDDSKADPQLAASWGIASKWTETSRYEIRDQFAAASIINAVRDAEHGVLQWLKQRW